MQSFVIYVGAPIRAAFRKSAFLSIITLSIFSFGTAAMAQAPAPGKFTPAKTAAPAPATNGVPSIEVLTMLVRTTIIAINQANQTGHYEVLYGITGPKLHKESSPSALGKALASFRQKDMDLSPVTVIPPQYVQQPVIDPQGQLRLVGGFPTQPLQVKFAFVFSNVEGHWKPEGISIDVAPPTPAPAQPAKPK